MKIIVAKGEANLVSTWQLYVRHIDNEQKLEDFAVIYETLKEVGGVQPSFKLSHTIKVLFSNNTVKNYEIYDSSTKGENSIFYNKDTETYFQSTESNLKDLYNDSGFNSNFELLWLVPIFGFMYIQRRIKKKMREIGVSNQNQFHSQSLKILSIIVFVFLSLLFAIAVFREIHLHFGWILLFALPITFINLFHKWRNGKNKWLIISYIFESLNAVFFFFLVFYVIH